MARTRRSQRTNKTRHKKRRRRTSGGKKNKLGVKNSLVNNINARRKKGISRSRKRKTVSKRSYKRMRNNWGKKKD